MLSVFQNSFVAPFFFFFSRLLRCRIAVGLIKIKHAPDSHPDHSCVHWGKWLILTLKSAPTKPRTTIRLTDPLLLSGNPADLRLQFQPRVCLELTLSDFCLEKLLSLSSVKGAMDPPGDKQGLKLGPISDSWQSGRKQALSPPKKHAVCTVEREVKSSRAHNQQ